jgi:hypothetical protein
MAPKIVTVFAAISVTLIGTAVGAHAKLSSVSRNQARLSTEHKFDGVDATGRYQSPLGATAVIESDKDTMNLIDFRSNFRDRAEQAQSGR